MDEEIFEGRVLSAEEAIELLNSAVSLEDLLTEWEASFAAEEEAA